MGVARKMLRGIGRRAADKVMDRLGGRLVSRIADTSSDAPSAFHRPKRDVYRHMQDGKLAAPPSNIGQDPASVPASVPESLDHDTAKHDPEPDPQR
ncbi:MAG: hypothetical protein GXP62_09985 [Oligoflexia bacterium]|nr:hypothetical protein [Oligoflexia bacterium]